MAGEKKVTGWRAWYAGGKVYDSKATAAWGDLPKVGMIGVCVYYADGTSFRVDGSCLYFCQPVGDDCIIGGTGFNVGPTQVDAEAAAIVSKYPGAVVIEGSYTTAEEMARMESERSASKVP